MHKAESELRRLLPFRTQIETIIGNLLSADADFSSPLTEVKPVERITIAIFGSDDGLCGAYNVNLFKFLRDHLAGLRDKYGLGVKFDIFPVGKKMYKATSKLQSDTITVHQLSDFNSKTCGDDVNRFEQMLQARFESGEAQRVDVVYMNFISLSRQRPRADRMLPLATDMFSAEKAKTTARPYIFEPDAAAIFQAALPMFLLAMSQEVFCENRASEQAARVMAMQSANDNAKKLLEQLQLEYNKLRQQSITSELLDIVGGQIRD